MKIKQSAVVWTGFNWHTAVWDLLSKEMSPWVLLRPSNCVVVWTCKMVSKFAADHVIWNGPLPRLFHLYSFPWHNRPTRA